MRVPHDILLYLRFVRSLLWEFRWSLIIFWGMVLLGGLETVSGAAIGAAIGAVGPEVVRAVADADPS